MSYENLIVSDQSSIRIISINRIQVHNALNKKVFLELKEILQDITHNNNIRALIITGCGEKSFVAGADISEMKSFSPMQAKQFSALGQDIFDALENLDIPVIAAVNGYALGGGLELALACDFIYASEKAVFGLVEAKLGLIPGFGGIARLAKRVGVAYAKEMVFAALQITAIEALRIGLVNKIVEHPNVLEEALKIAEKITQCAPLAVLSAKKLLNQAQYTDLATCNKLEQANFGLIFSTSDHTEGINAFLEKRKSMFEGA
jgi:enoyl-CoA hydratase